MRLAPVAAVVLFVPALAAAQPYTFVSTPAGDSLTMLDLADDSVAGSFPVGGLPTGGAVGRGGRRVYTALTEANALAILDIRTGDLRTVPVGARPAAVVVARRKVYVANSSDDTVSVVDPRQGVVVATIPVGDVPIALAGDGPRVYVANGGDRTVSVVETAANTVVGTVPVGTFPAALSLHRATRRLYVANFLDGTVSVIDTDTLSVVSTFPVTRRPRGLAVDAAGQRLFVAGFEDGRVQVVDTATGTVSLDVASGGPNPMDLLLGPQETRLYVAHLQEEQGVAVLDAATLSPVASVDVPAGPVAFAGLTRRRPRLAAGAGWLETARVALARVRNLVAMVATRPADVPRQSFGDEVVITDTRFEPAHWALGIGGPFEFEVSQQTTGGNPGEWRRTTHFAPGIITHRLIRPGSEYTPSTLGAILTLDVSWDRRLFADTIIGERFVVEQDGVVYRAVENNFFETEAWETVSQINLVAADFSSVSGAHPDFSETGSTLRFGYARQTFFDAAVPHGIDNFVVTVHRSGSAANQLGFAETAAVVEESDAPFVHVQRRNGTQGAVSVDVLTERPDGSTQQDTVSWADGDGFDKSVLLVFLTLPDGSGARTARLRLLNPTGGATIDASRDQMMITVFPEQWPEQIRALFIRLQGFLSAFSPAGLILLGAPGMAMAALRRRKRS
jgi:YVTN family beta-propeller protein